MPKWINCGKTGKISYIIIITVWDYRRTDRLIHNFVSRRKANAMALIGMKLTELVVNEIITYW